MSFNFVILCWFVWGLTSGSVSHSKVRWAHLNPGIQLLKWTGLSNQERGTRYVWRYLNNPSDHLDIALFCEWAGQLPVASSCRRRESDCHLCLNTKQKFRFPNLLGVSGWTSYMGCHLTGNSVFMWALIKTPGRNRSKLVVFSFWTSVIGKGLNTE